MGSFSYSCQLSGLPITSGTMCAIVPMLPKDNYYDCGEDSFRKEGKAMFCSNDGANMFFNEYAFPIFGEYNDYGAIENIIKDDNTKCLEEYFELSIEDICDVLCDRDYKKLKSKNPKHALLKKSSLVWLHGEFYNNLLVEKSAHWNDKLDLGGSGILDKLGFKYVGIVEKERYNREYEKDGLKIWSDGNWINLPDQHHVYTLTDLKKYCEKKGVALDIETLNNMGYHEQVYECVLPYINDLKGGDRWKTDRAIGLLLGDGHKIKMSGASSNDLSLKLLSHQIESLEKEEKPFIQTDLSIEDLKSNYEKLKKIIAKELPEPDIYLSQYYFDKVKSVGNGFLKSNIIAWHKVKSYYYVLGKYLYPIGTSPQDGDFKSTKLFFDTVSSTIDSIMKKRTDDGYEDDEDDEF